MREHAARDPNFTRLLARDPRAAMAACGLRDRSWNDPTHLADAAHRAIHDPRGWRARARPHASSPRDGMMPLRDVSYSGAIAKTRVEGPRITQTVQPRLRLVFGQPPPDAKPQEALGGALRAVKLWQITGGVRVIDAGPNGRFSSEDVDVDRHYGVPTRSRIPFRCS